MPRHQAAMPARPPSSKRSACLKPWFSSPMRFSAGTRTFSRMTSAVAREPLDDEQVGERVGPAAAHVLGQRDAHEAERAEALHGLVREALLAVPRGGVRLHLALAEVADRLLDVAVLVGEREVHHAARG